MKKTSKSTSKAERHAAIPDMVDRGMTVKEMAKEFRVTPRTISKDLSALGIDLTNTPEDIDYRVEITARMYCQHFTQKEIAEKIGCAQSTVSSYLAKAKELWRTSPVARLEERLAVQLERVDALEAEAYEGWRVSQERRTVRSQTSKQKGSGEDDKAVEVTQKFQERTTPGDPAFLKIIMGCIQERSKLLDLYKADINLSVGGAASTVIMTDFKKDDLKDMGAHDLLQLYSRVIGSQN
jgi:predicted transcriptional regulator